MMYIFSDAKTLQDRFNSAAQIGEAMEWIILENNGDNGSTIETQITGTWWWTTDSSLNGRTYPEDSKGLHFSLENSCWGAGSPHVSGGFDLFDMDLRRDMQYGQGEIEGGCCDMASLLPQGSSTCGHVWIAGKKIANPTLQSELYVIVE